MNYAMKSYMEPAKPEICLSQEVYDYLVWLIPEGMLTTDESIREFLSNTLDCGCIDFALPVMKYTTIKGLAEKIVKIVPHHRVVSKRGYISDPFARDKLIAEGFELELPKGNRGYRVKNIKRVLFDYNKVEYLDTAFIMRIQNEGIERFIPINLDA